LFGGKKTYNEDAGDQKTSSYTGDAKKVESKDGDEGPRRKITDYIQKAPSDVAGSVSSTPATSSAPVTSSAPKAASAKPAVAADEPVGLTTPVSSANRTDQLANLSRAVKREDATKKAAQGEFSGITRTYTKRDGTPAVKAQETYDTLNKKSGANNSSAMKTDALKVASRAAAKADSLRRAAKQSSYKSGGMTASSRADGIATKGKTRGKIC
jgi:hypothetical protein